MKDGAKKNAAKKNALEWTVFGASLALILLVVGVLTWEGVRDEGRQPELEIRLGEPSHTPSGHRVPVGVRNIGDRTAEEAVIEVVLMKEGKEVERSELTFAFVPRQSQRHGWVLFAADPRCCELKAATRAYEEP